jgi:hypothetical protein
MAAARKDTHMRRLLALAAAVLLAAGLGLATAPEAAHAASCPADDTCSTGGVYPNLAMNNWSGSNTKVYAYAEGKTNEDFGTEPIDRCGGSYKVTSTCPFSDHSMDSALLGHDITQTLYAGGSQAYCVGVDNTTNTDAVLLGCNDPSTGTGGGLWTVFVVAGNDSLVSLGCTNYNDSWCQLDGNAASSQDYFALSSQVQATYWTPLP